MATDCRFGLVQKVASNNASERCSALLLEQPGIDGNHGVQLTSPQLDRCPQTSAPAADLGGYPALSLKDAHQRRDEARALLARNVDPRTERKRQAILPAGEHTFKAGYGRWLAHRRLSLEEGRQSTLERIERVFGRDVLPRLGH